MDSEEYFNVVLDPLLDVSRVASYLSYSTLISIKKRVHEVQLVYVWMIIHSMMRDYTYTRCCTIHTHN